MNEIESAVELRHAIGAARMADRSIGLVPTMGYLHAGHLKLVEEARAENDVVVMSLFVNPTQFGPNEDFDRYPRDRTRDRDLAADAGVDILFAPAVGTMYPQEQAVWVEPGALAAHLCGASRPIHFRGVCTVVTKLFNMVTPDRAYFGQKDAQQALILRRMVADLAFPIEVCIVPTVREGDGLAQSSRNVFLSPEERKEAPALWRGLRAAGDAIMAGERDPHAIEGVLCRVIERDAPHARVEYATIVDLETLQPLDRALDRDALIAVAAHFGSTRLIDNVLVRWRDGVARVT